MKCIGSVLEVVLHWEYTYGFAVVWLQKKIIVTHTLT